jgi:hypothetical protein
MGSSFYPCVPVEYEHEPHCVKYPVGLIGCGWGGHDRWLEAQSAVGGIFFFH